jgi:hypothetical protein
VSRLQGMNDRFQARASNSWQIGNVAFPPDSAENGCHHGGRLRGNLSHPPHVAVSAAGRRKRSIGGKRKFVGCRP